MLRTKIFKASKNFQDRRKPLWSEKMRKGAEKFDIQKKKFVKNIRNYEPGKCGSGREEGRQT